MFTRVMTQVIKKLPQLMRPSYSLLTQNKYYKSGMSIEEIKKVIGDEIKAEESNVKDIESSSKWFKGEGWTINHDRTLVELSKSNDTYHIRLLSNIKSP